MSDSLSEVRDTSFASSKSKLGIQYRRPFNKQELKGQVKEITDLATTDSMTGLLNRYGLITGADKISKVLEREEKFENYYVVGLDMIGLKKLNDELTSSGADQLLVESARVFDENAERAEDLVSRWGGDEFVILTFNTNEGGVESLISKIKTKLPAKSKFNFVFKEFSKTDDIKESISEVVDQIEVVKKQGPKDQTGRSIGDGVVVELS